MSFPIKNTSRIGKRQWGNWWHHNISKIMTSLILLKPLLKPKLKRHDHSRSLVRVVSQQSLGRAVLEHCGRWKHLSPKVLSPYFLSPCRKWHKKGSSPTNHSNAEVLRPSVYSNVVGFHGRGFIANIAMSWVLRPRVYSNVHALLSRYVYLLGSCSRVITHDYSRLRMLYSNVPFEVRDLKRYIMMYQAWTYFFGPLSTDIHEDILFESLDFQGFVRPIVCCVPYVYLPRSTWRVLVYLWWLLVNNCRMAASQVGTASISSVLVTTVASVNVHILFGHVCAGYVPFFVAYIPSVPN